MTQWIPFDVNQTFDVLIRGAECMLPSGLVRADIGVCAGKIAAIGDLSQAKAAELIDASHWQVLPGLIDTQVHFREPGHEYKEDLATGSQAAVLGGMTGVFDMPNNNPIQLTQAQFEAKIQLATGRMWSNFAFYIGGSASNYESLAQLERLPGCCGVKVFMGSSTGDLLAEDDETLLKILQHGVRRVAIHAEDNTRLKERKHIAEAAAHARAHHIWRDEIVCLRATERILKLARKVGRRIHVLHVTTAQEMALLAQHKDIATVEVLPQHLTLDAPACYERLGSLAQMNPPIRELSHQAALWQALEQGVIDCMGSDHAPHTLEEKAKVYPDSPSGLPGTQTMLPIMLNHVNAGKLSLTRLVDLLSAGPSRIFGLVRKGRIAVGYDADFTFIDLNATRVIRNDWIASKVKWTPFDGMTVKGWPMLTMIGGKTVMREDQLVGAPIGRAFEFVDTLAKVE